MTFGRCLKAFVFIVVETTLGVQISTVLLCLQGWRFSIRLLKFLSLPPSPQKIKCTKQEWFTCSTCISHTIPCAPPALSSPHAAVGAEIAGPAAALRSVCRDHPSGQYTVKTCAAEDNACSAHDKTKTLLELTAHNTKWTGLQAHENFSTGSVVVRIKCRNILYTVYVHLCVCKNVYISGDTHRNSEHCLLSVRTSAFVLL